MKITSTFNQQFTSGGSVKKTPPGRGRVAFKALVPKKVSPQFESMSGRLISEVGKFLASPKDTVKFLGSGVSAAVYMFLKFPQIVIKQAFNQKETFEDEQQHLQMIPDEVTHSQRFVARLFDDETGRHYLLSTYVRGNSADLSKNPWTKNHFDSLFQTLFEMDKVGLYHGDLNNGNLKLTVDGEVNIIDWQWAQKIPYGQFFDEKDGLVQPGFLMPDNAQMFEMKEFSDYLALMKNKREARELFRTYLKSKSVYHAKRAAFTEKMFDGSENAVAAKIFETAKSKVFENSSDAVISVEAKKIGFIDMFRHSYEIIDSKDKKKNRIPAGASFLYTMSAIRDFQKTVHDSLKRAEREKEALEKISENLFCCESLPEFPEELRRKEYLTNEISYLKMQSKFGEFWFDKISLWSKDVFEYVLRQISGNYPSWEQELSLNEENTKPGCFRSLPDMPGALGEQSRFNATFDNISFYVKNDTDACEKLLTRVKSALQNKNPETIAELLKVHGEMLFEIFENSGCDVINTALLMLLKTKSLYGCGIDDLVNELKSKYESIAKRYFYSIHSQIVGNLPESGILSGYEDGGNFSEKSLLQNDNDADVNNIGAIQ